MLSGFNILILNKQLRVAVPQKNDVPGNQVNELF